MRRDAPALWTVQGTDVWESGSGRASYMDCKADAPGSPSYAGKGPWIWLPVRSLYRQIGSNVAWEMWWP